MTSAEAVASAASVAASGAAQVQGAVRVQEQLQVAPPVPGTWLLRRRVLDRSSGERGSARGTMTVTADEHGQRWSEEGVLRWAGAQLPFTRELLVRRREGEWWVLFADGRPFHPWRPGEAVVHPCGQDVYTGRVEVSAREVRTWWDVQGPCKDQHLETRLALRAPSTPSAAAADLADPDPDPTDPDDTTDPADPWRTP